MGVASIATARLMRDREVDQWLNLREKDGKVAAGRIHVALSYMEHASDVLSNVHEGAGGDEDDEEEETPDAAATADGGTKPAGDAGDGATDAGAGPVDESAATAPKKSANAGDDEDQASDISSSRLRGESDANRPRVVRQMRNMDSLSNIVADYQVRVHVWEARNLQGED